jgi:hypothetical protein
MPRRNLTEWHCERCGEESVIESNRQHGWMILGISGYQGNPKEERFNIGGDICPDCVKSLVSWWKDRR